MSQDNGNGDQPQRARAICGVLMVLPPDGGPLQLFAQPASETFERLATSADISSMWAQLGLWCQQQAVLNGLREQQREVPRIVRGRG